MIMSMGPCFGLRMRIVGNKELHPDPNGFEESYELFRDKLIARHQHPMASALSTVGDVLVVIGFLTLAIRRSRRLGAAGIAVGVSSAVVAHLFQPGTLKNELGAILSHPLWAAKAERQRLLAG